MKKCSNGHYYADDLDKCPYCPTGVNKSSDVDETRTLSENHLSNDDKTQVFGENSSDDDKTKIFGNNQEDKTRTYKGGNQNFDPEKTSIFIPDEKEKDAPVIREQKKLVGWLISYTIDPMGVDFRIYEGKNVIGSAADNEVSIFSDSSVSSKHATILFRGGVFMIKDEFSTNGTFVNGKMLITDTPVLKDGDEIRVGNTLFKFKSAF